MVKVPGEPQKGLLLQRERLGVGALRAAMRRFLEAATQTDSLGSLQWWLAVYVRAPPLAGFPLQQSFASPAHATPRKFR